MILLLFAAVPGPARAPLQKTVSATWLDLRAISWILWINLRASASLFLQDGQGRIPSGDFRISLAEGGCNLRAWFSGPYIAFTSDLCSYVA